ncbi:MAG: FeoB-associated Cys-rich membrane protein [Clostridiaceae bacterium]
MSIWDYLVLALVALVVGLATWRMIRRRKQGACGCCSACAGGCAGCARAGNCDGAKTK